MAPSASQDDRPEDLTESPHEERSEEQPAPTRFIIMRGQQSNTNNSNNNANNRNNKLMPPTLQSLHPYTRPLTISDLESCVALENAAFENEAERCTRDKFAYRLTKCGELSLGIFCTVTEKENEDLKAGTYDAAGEVETGRANKARSVLMAHIVSTKTRDHLSTDEAMDYPRDWATAKANGKKIGHHDDGRTICLHSLAVLPSLQKNGIGRTLMEAYIQQMNGAGIADRLALIAHDHLVPYYENLGFKSQGPSKAQFGGGGWVDMIFELKPIEARAAYG